MLENNHLIGFGAGETGSSHRYWRVRNTQQATYYGNPTGFPTTEIEMRSVSGSAASDLCSGGSVIKSSEYGTYLAAYAFDNNTVTTWYAATTSVGEWIGYDFGAPVLPAELWFNPYSPYGVAVQVPAIAIDYSDDGSTWTQQKEYTGLAWSAGVPQTFAF